MPQQINIAADGERQVNAVKKDLFNKIIAVLLPEMDNSNTRKAPIESALYSSPMLQKIQKVFLITVEEVCGEQARSANLNQ